MRSSGRASFFRQARVAVAIWVLAASIVPVTLGADQLPGPRGRTTAAIEVSGSIAVDTTWRATDSPVVITGQTIVGRGVTLTIEPGVEVRVQGGGELVVYGQVVGLGTVAAPISFTAADGVTGSWNGISVIGGGDAVASVTLRHATIANGAGPAGRGAQLTAYLGALDLENVTIRDGAGIGVLVESAGLRMSRVTVSGNAGEAIRVTGLQTSEAAYAPHFDGVTVAGNGQDAVVLVGPGGFGADATLPDLGVPYEIRGQITSAAGATLRIEPGTELRFAEASELVVSGHLEAAGTVEAPIVLRGVADAAGSWHGIALSGGQEPATGHFERVTIRSAGQDGRAALLATNARVTFFAGAVTDSAGDGIVINGTAQGTSRIEGSAITGLGGVGLRNDTGSMVLAPQDWWGDASGPTVDGSCSGSGSRVVGNVRYVPWLAASDQQPDPFAPVQVPTISVEPERVYAPADGQTRVWVNLTLRDAYGHPLPNRAVELTSTHGAATSGGVTDAAGHTRGWVTADSPGDAEVSAGVVSDNPCERADAGTALVSFAQLDDQYLAGMVTPYLFDGLEFDPEPVTQGVKTTLRARLVNPNTEPVRIEAEFDYADFGLGLAFGPIGTRIVKEIPGGGEATFETSWLPPLTGHYCLQIRYRILGPGETARRSRAIAAVVLPPGWTDRLIDASNGSSSGGANTNSRPGGPPLQQFGGAPQPPNRDGANKVVGGFKSVGFGAPADIIGGLSGDPPRQDYTIVAPIERLPVVYWPREAGWSDARWTAEQALVEAIFEFDAIGSAAIVSLDRYGGAAAAAELRWSAVQLSSLLYYRGELGKQARVLADKVAALAAIIERETPDEGMTLEAAQAELDRLRASGFTAEERAFGQALGLDAAGLERLLAWSIDQTPAGLAGRTVDQLRKVEAYYREVGTSFATARMFPDESGPTAAVGDTAAVGSELARIVDETVPFEVGNPLDHEATIELRVRPIALPAGWTATVSPGTVTLAPGARMTATVTLSPSGPVVQGTIARVAVEGFVDSSLLGGVVVGVVVPEYVPFPGPSTAAGGGELPLGLIVGGAAVAALLVVVIVLVAVRRRGRQAA